MPTFNVPTLILMAGLAGLAACIAGCGTDLEPGAPFYGNQGNEHVMPAEGNGKLPLRARKELAFYTLKNPRKSERRFGKESLSVDWEVFKTGESQQVSIVVHPANEQPQVVNVSSDFRNSKQGTVTLEVAFGFGSRADVPTNVEFYLVAHDWRIGDLQFKVSNSVTLGSASYTYARNWSQEEIDRISKVWPAPNGGSSNAPGGVPTVPQTAVAQPGNVVQPGLTPAAPVLGVDTEWLGNSTGGSPQRFAQKEKPLLGFNYALGDWAGGPCLAKLIPIYSTEPPGDNQMQVIAEEGYVVGGLQVNADKVVRGVRLVLMKLNEDGTLDPADTHTSDWAGVATGSPTKLGGDGRKLLGVHLRQGLIVDAIAAVVEKAD